MLDSTYKLISKEFQEFDVGLNSSLPICLDEFAPVLQHFFKAPGKKIRPVLGILLSKCLGSFNTKQNIFLQAIELIHNATLFHDDVIDEATTRRNTITLNQKFSNKIAILSGDYFLSCALKNIATLANPEINLLLANCITQLCKGELEQDLNINKIITMEKYLQKTEDKTAKLFELTLQGCTILSENKNKKIVDTAKELGKNFGMLFQIRDDLKNFQIETKKPYYNDLQSGIYTAPILFLAQQYKNIPELLVQKNWETIIDMLKNSNAFAQTQELIDKYYKKTLAELANLPQNQYSKELKSLLSEFRNNC